MRIVRKQITEVISNYQAEWEEGKRVTHKSVPKVCDVMNNKEFGIEIGDAGSEE